MPSQIKKRTIHLSATVFFAIQIDYESIYRLEDRLGLQTSDGQEATDAVLSQQFAEQGLW